LASAKNAAGKQSVLYQLTGGIANIFWTGVVALGVVIPLTIAFYSYFSGEAAAALLISGAVCEIIGGMLLRYCLLKSAIYNPLIVDKQDSLAA
jgi:formate-dependent nitrite reductase membrane component NrfD